MRRSTLAPLLCLPSMFGCAADSLDSSDNASEPGAQEILPADPGGVTQAAVGEPSAAVQADLDQLAALEVFEVGKLLARYPEGALNCYGVCPEFEDEIAAANQRAGERLATLSERIATAINTNAAVEPDACEQAAIDTNLAALRALEVIEVGEFIAVVPQNNPACYNVPCPQDTEAAAQETCDRAATLARIASEL